MSGTEHCSSFLQGCEQFAYGLCTAILCHVFWFLSQPFLVCSLA